MPSARFNINSQNSTAPHRLAPTIADVRKRAVFGCIEEGRCRWALSNVEAEPEPQAIGSSDQLCRAISKALQ